MKYLVRSKDIPFLEIDQTRLIDSVHLHHTGRNMQRDQWGDVWIYDGDEGEDLFMAIKYGMAPPVMYEEEYKQLSMGGIFFTKSRYKEILDKLYISVPNRYANAI